MKKRMFALLLLLVWMMGSVASASLLLKPRWQKAGEDTGVPALVFEREVGYAKWRTSGNRIKITFNMENLDPDATIDAFDIQIYCMDVYEETICPQDGQGDGVIREYTLEKTIKPGKATYSGYCSIVGCKGVKYIVAAVKRYHYKKGGIPGSGFLTPNDKNTVEIADSDLQWYTWTYKK